ncbi:PP2C family protein-serine/threonine phosphatase [Bradyrhizobium sp. AZCC 1699]|uniref:PP2C family protein-serine/threonine phosphatase n=1 Tax=Bradyrhizobium sp. AZCC 1699 TaxID=3117024 RepID=UPI002FEEAA9E
MTSWTIAAFTHRGRVRPDNEDAIAIGDRIFTGDMDTPVVVSVPNECCHLMIADGMGGHAHGAMASRAVLDHLVGATDRLSNPDFCAEAIEEANQHLFALMQDQRESVGMGATLVGAILSPNTVLAFNVGDSRSYHFGAGQLTQLSFDDVPEDEGPLRSHAITQALGGASFPVSIDPHVSLHPSLAVGESLLLCSDGLTDMLSNQIIYRILNTAEDPLRAVRKLAATAFRVGALDNISIIVCTRAAGS